MTLLAIEGFDHFTTAQAGDKKWAVSNGGISSAYGRFGGQGFGITSSAGNYGYKNLPANKSTIYCGVAIIKAESGPVTYSSSYPLIAFRDESSVVQVRLHVLADFSIAAYQGDGTLLGTSAAGVFLDQYWQYLEVKITISATV